MIAAKTAACGADLPPASAVANERRDFDSQIRVERILPVQPIARMNGPVVPGFLVDGVGTDHLHFAAIDLRRKSVDHGQRRLLDRNCS